MSSAVRKISIRTRLLFMVLSLIFLIFLVILAVFNVLVTEYIKNSVREQLTDAIQVIAEANRPPYDPPEKSAPESGAGSIPDMRGLPRGPIGKAEAILVSAEYELILPKSGLEFMRNYDDINALVARLKTERVDLDSRSIMSLNASGREYYFVAGKTPGSPSGEDAYLVYYIDMTAVTSFSDRINHVLLWVMGMAGILAAVITIFLSGRIARPIKELTRFAVRIGQGDFSTRASDYRDIELSDLAQSMNRAAAQLDAYDKEQKTFFQNVSHELRTPLQTIKSSAEGIEHGILAPEKSSRVIINETDRLSEMVDDILYLSRIDSISDSSRPVECDLREILSNCAERQRGLAGRRGISFVFDFDPQPVNFNCDEKRMARAFSNLISNAIRYAAGSITLYCHQENGVITIKVADDGEGISEQDLPHIFDRFYKGKGGKHGIGLSIVKTIIEQRQGSIEIRNTAAGAEFIIRL